MASQSAPPSIVWFRDDLRLSDHPALHAAASTGRPVICLYVFDEPGRSAGARPLGGAARWRLAQSLRALQKRLHAVGAPLVLRQGPPARIIADIARTTGAAAVFWNEIAQAPLQAVAGEVAAALREIGVTSQSFPGDLLVAPGDIRNKEGRGLRVFAPFWRRVQALGIRQSHCPHRRRCVRGRTLRAIQSKAGVLSRRGRIGPLARAIHGRWAS
jgi:deoxyribodipyrimidine photo-lyase